MNFKKIFLLLVPLLTFLGIGTMLSNIESGYADELLEAHGLTNNTRYFRTDSDESISSFLQYLDKNYRIVRFNYILIVIMKKSRS